MLGQTGVRKVVMTESMHVDEIPVDAATVRDLISRQFPHWAELPLTRVQSFGTVNAIFRLGADKAVRLPLFEQWGEAIEHEAEWLPRLAPHLPVRIPAVIGRGRPDDSYPSQWLVLDWLPGRTPTPGNADGAHQVALDLANFVTAFKRIDTAAAPPGYRGGSLHGFDEAVRDALGQVADLVDVARLTRSWEESLLAAPWAGEPVWAHSDLLAGNVLVDNGRLVGVLDFGTAGVGDPAADALAAWSILPADARETFRASAEMDDATWLRGRGWALCQAAFALPYYRETNRFMASNSLHMLTELLADS